MTSSRRKTVDMDGDSALLPYSLAQQSAEDRQLDQVLRWPKVKDALFAFESAEAKRDSVSRKLAGGSTAVSVADLARVEGCLADAKATLTHLAAENPILARHPTISRLSANS